MVPAPMFVSRADLGVAEVGEMHRLGAGADDGVLGLDEVADVHPRAESRAGAQLRERADLHVVGDARPR